MVGVRHARRRRRKCALILRQRFIDSEGVVETTCPAVEVSESKPQGDVLGRLIYELDQMWLCFLVSALDEIDGCQVADQGGPGRIDRQRLFEDLLGLCGLVR